MGAERPSEGRPRVLAIQYTNPAAYPPIEHALGQLARAGAGIRVLGLARAEDPLVLPREAGLDVRLVRPAPPGWRQKVHYAGFAVRVLLAAATFRPRYVYASDPLSCPIALVLSYLPRMEVVYAEHDSPEESGGDASWFMRVVLGARRRLAGRATLCVLPNEERSATFERTTGAARVMTAWNTPTSDEVTDVPRRPRTGPLRLWFHGSIVPARLPLSLVRALAASNVDATLDVVGYETAGHAGYAETIRRTAVDLGIGDRVRVHGPLPRRELLRRSSEADVGIALLPIDSRDSNERTMVGASNKPFDYLARGLALLVPSLPAWQTAFVARGLARSCDPASVDQLVDAIRWFDAHREETAAMGQRGREVIRSEWHYERAFGPVLAALRLTRGVAHGR